MKLTSKNVMNASKLQLFLKLCDVGRVLRLRRNTYWRQKYERFDSILSRAGLEHLGWIVDDTTRRLPYWANGLFYPSWNRSYRFTAYR